MMNQGMWTTEMAETYDATGLRTHWSAREYYGTISNNSKPSISACRLVRRKILGSIDGRASTRPRNISESMGGSAAVIAVHARNSKRGVIAGSLRLMDQSRLSRALHKRERSPRRTRSQTGNLANREVAKCLLVGAQELRKRRPQ